MPIHDRKSKTKVVYKHTAGSKHPNRGAVHTRCAEPGHGQLEMRCWGCNGKRVVFEETANPCRQGGS